MKFLIDEMINDDQIAHMQMIMIMTGNSAIQYLKMKFNDYWQKKQLFLGVIKYLFGGKKVPIWVAADQTWLIY